MSIHQHDSSTFSATAGRLDYLRRTSLAAEGMEWLQRPLLAPPVLGAASEADIARGFDFLTTDVAFQRIRVPAEMLGEGMESFDEVVRFEGAPLSPSTGNADTIMERLDDATFGTPVRTQLVGFGNVSSAPIELRGTGFMAGRYHVYVTLSPTSPSYGQAVYRSGDDGANGWVDSTVSLTPLFELRPVDGGDSIFVDTGVTPIPGFPMSLTSDSGRWSRVPTHVDEVAWTRTGESLFYPEPVLILATGAVQDVDPMEVDVRAEITEVLRRHALPAEHPDHIGDVPGSLSHMGFQSMCAKSAARFRLMM